MSTGNKIRSPRWEGFFWQPFRHACGCYLEWGSPLPDCNWLTQKGPTITRAVHEAVQGAIFRFLKSIREYPCPMHGSASGKPAPPLKEGEQRLIPECYIWYTTCPPERHVYGDRVADAFHSGAL